MFQAIKQLRYNLVRSFKFLRNWVQPPYKKPSKEKRVKLSNDFNINSSGDIRALNVGQFYIDSSTGRFVWDLEGVILDGANQSGSGGQNDKKNEPLFTVNMKGLHIKNFMFDNVKEAIHWDATDGMLENGVFLKIGEDAVSTPQPKEGYLECGKNLIISKVHFQNWGGDKSLQFNQCDNIVVKDCTFVGCNTGIRWGSEKMERTNIGYSKGNKFYSVRTCHHASGPKTVVYIDRGSEKYVWAKEPEYTNHDAKFKDKKASDWKI